VSSLDSRIENREGGYQLRLTPLALVVGLLVLSLTAVGVRSQSGRLPSVAVAPVVVLALTFVPGGLAMVWARSGTQVDARHIVYAVGISLLALMGVGAVVNIVGPLLGVDRPLSPVPLASGIGVLVGLLAVGALVGSDGPVEFDIPRLLDPVPLALLLLPLVGILSVVIWNRLGTNVPLLIVLTVAALSPLALLAVDTRWHALGIWSLSLTILYHSSLWQYNGFGGNPAGIWTANEGLWTPGISQVTDTSSELLQNGVLFPLYATLADVGILTQYEAINPFFVSFLPVVLFVTFRRYTTSQVGLLGAALFVFAHPFYIQYPQAGRSATPVLFLALLGCVISDVDSLGQPLATGLALLFSTGIVVAHYGTAYFAMFALIGAVGLVACIKVVDAYRESGFRHSISGIRADGGVGRRLVSRPYGVLSATFVVWYTVFAIAWYLFLAGGRRFSVLPNHAYNSVMQLLGGDLFGGRTAARVQRDYGSSVIDISQRLYIAVAMATAVGLAYAYYRRLATKEGSIVDDSYLSIATMLLGLFGVTFIVRNWGGGRPMMIAFAFVAVFAVVGTVIGTSVVGYLAQRHRASTLGAYLTNRSFTREWGLWVFGIFLAVLLLLNAGVASAVVLGGDAPSNVPIQSEGDRETDIATHVWMIDHHDGPSVYGDYTAEGQTDWYRSEIVASTDPMADYEGWRPQGELNEIGTETDFSERDDYGYVMLLGHNVEDGTVWTGHEGHNPSVDQHMPPLDDHTKIYTSGKSEIYHWPGSED